jgi:protease-4
VLAGTYEKLGIHHTTLRSTSNAGLMGDLQPFDDAQRARVRRQLEAFYDRFVQRVAENRQLEVEKARAAAGGRVWSGMRARELGLVDELGDFQTAVARAEDLAGLDAGTSRLVDYQPRPGLYERMLHRLFQSALPAGGPAESLRLSRLLPPQLLGFDGSVQYRLPWQWQIR